MPSFILVRKLVLVLCIISSLILSLPPPTINKTPLDPITYGILRFHQLRGEGGGLFGLDPENKVMVNGLIWNLVPIMLPMILVNMQNFKLLAFLLLEILYQKNSPSRMEHLSWHPFLHFYGFEVKQNKLVFSIFWDVSFQQQLKQLQWWIDFAKILLKCV